MGVVYAAHDDVMDRPVAIKRLKGDVDDDPELASRFQREAQATGQLVHRNIITVFDLGTENGRPYIVMELLDGITLADYVKSTPPPRLEDKLDIMMQLCEGLQLAHSKRIYHRDIKPGNLVVCADRTLKIVDFGIARLAASNLTMSGLIVGTPDYMSPEQARGQEVDQRSDLFSAGGVLYFMLTGRKPFPAREVTAVLEMVRSHDPLPLRASEAPEELAAIVTKALAKSVTDRFQTAGELAAALSRFARSCHGEAAHARQVVHSRLVDLTNCCEQINRTLTSLDADVAEMRGGQFDPQSWAARLAALRERGSLVGDDWMASQDWLRDVDALRVRAEEHLSTLQQADAALERGAQTLLAGELTQSLSALEQACALAPFSKRARLESERVRALVSEKRATLNEVHALLAEALDATKRGDWLTVLAVTERVLVLDAGNLKADELRARATATLAEEAQKRRARRDGILEQAEKLLRQKRYDEAEQALNGARQLEPSSSTIRAFEDRLRNERLIADRATERQRVEAEVVARAQAVFQSGSRAEALAALQQHLARDPQAARASAVLAKLTADADRLAQNEARLEQANVHVQAAEDALGGDEPERAAALANDALALVSDHPRARAIKSLATARLQEREMKRVREAKIKKALSDARAALAKRRFADARAVIRSAFPGGIDLAEAATLLAAIDRDEAETIAEKRRLEDRRRCEEAVAPILARAIAAHGRGELAKASWLAENALAIHVESADARLLLEKIEKTLAERPDLADDTVETDSQLTGAGADDTLTLTAEVSSWRRMSAKITSWARTMSRNSKG